MKKKGTQKKLATVMPREQPVKDRGADVADMDLPRRAGSKTYAHGHGAFSLGFTPLNSKDFQKPNA